MSDTELKALAGVRINVVPTQDDVWRRSEFHVDTLHRDVANAILDAIGDARDESEASPVGVVVQGQRGSGKTHLLGWVREQVQQQDGYFFLVSLLDGSRFWYRVANSMIDGLARRVDGAETQLLRFLKRLTLLTGVPFAARQAVIGETPLDRTAVEAVLAALDRFRPDIAMACRQTLRALVVLSAGDFRSREVGTNFLLSGDESEPGERAQWGLQRAAYPPESVVSEISRLLALTGPSVVAVDQIDGLLAPLAKAMTNGLEAEWQDSVVLDQIADGLMSLREATHRTLTVIAAQHSTWEVIRNYAIAAVQDRFVATQNLGRIPTPAVGRELVARRLEPYYRTAAFTPPYATWPVEEDAFDEAVDFMPRQLLQIVNAHIRKCVADSDARVLPKLTKPTGEVADQPVLTDPPADALAALDKRFAELREAADIGRTLTKEAEDVELPPLLSAGLQAWIIERGAEARHFEQDARPSTKPVLHARLRRILDDEAEVQAHWGFRGISAEYHPTAVLNRIRAASTESGLAQGVHGRRLFLLRNTEWPTSPKNREAVAAFQTAGGRRLAVTDNDLRILWALREMSAKPSVDLPAWLVDRRPTCEVAFLREALADAATDLPASPRGKPIEEIDQPPQVGADLEGAAFHLGLTVETGEPVPIFLEALRKHAAVFAGSGSGKTVLLRRIIEECALQGVSSIVLDPNNDLARLGDPWPEEPPGWLPGDAAKAKEYLENTDVVVYTPRRQAGRPISFQPLPDFQHLVDDLDEFEAAIDAALVALAPRAKIAGTTSKAQRGQAILKESLTYYARRHQRTTLRGFIGMLDDLPVEASSFGDIGPKIASELGEALTAATVIDPLFGGVGEPVDPGELLRPRPGKRARISVISMIGLGTEDGPRQSFVNQLQMALFAWVKKNPAGDRPLGGLFVMDEAQTLAPSGAITACTKSTIALASQARKYGLGLVFATQAPKGLHNQIPGNAATQFYGLLNSPVQIEAAREMARAKGGDVPGISQLSSGQFYVALEGRSFVKARTPLCLSYHPKSPLTTEEVLDRSRHNPDD
ncbi:ATP-binding protein [Actinoplanes sp. NPDC051411]|uniref:ATP-binding protein n=1 Tax=Actinoplanes sp. NPDC051411 TaxID=3155522 RepID=UPI0034304E69